MKYRPTHSAIWTLLFALWTLVFDYRLSTLDYRLSPFAIYPLYSIIYTLHIEHVPCINKLLSCFVKPAGNCILGIWTVSKQVVWPHWLHLKCTWSCWWVWSPWWHSSLHKAYFTPPLSSKTLWSRPCVKKVFKVRYTVTRSYWSLSFCSMSPWLNAKSTAWKVASTSTLQGVDRRSKSESEYEELI